LKVQETFLFVSGRVAQQVAGSAESRLSETLRFLRVVNCFAGLAQTF